MRIERPFLLGMAGLAILATSASADALDDYLGNWSARAQAALDSQPHWIPPINTITPRLTQVVRYDQYWQDTNSGGGLNAFDSGKGVEIIPLETTSVTFNLPAYDERRKKGIASGWADWPIALIKQRLLAAPEDAGDYILTGFLSFQAPTGSAAFTNHAWVISPGLGFGKGWGDFNIQGNVVAALPTSRAGTIGTAVTTNLMTQYHLAKYFWPEVELNDTTWSGGVRRGKNQLFMTTGALLGNIPLFQNYAVGVGVGYQFALSPNPAIVLPALTPSYDHNWILTLRLVY